MVTVIFTYVSNAKEISIPVSLFMSQHFSKSFTKLRAINQATPPHFQWWP